jgi:pimeloyl-ACP methyl ester carboxylesterase
MAVATAATFPRICTAVITEAAQAFVEHQTIAGIVAAKTSFAKPDQLARLARYHGDKARWVLDAWTETWLSSDFSDWKLDAELEQLACPVLALHGDRDEYGSVAHPEQIVALAGGISRKAVLNDCGHVPHREHPDAVTTLITSFLADVADNEQ